MTGTRKRRRLLSPPKEILLWLLLWIIHKTAAWTTPHLPPSGPFKPQQEEQQSLSADLAYQQGLECYQAFYNTAKNNPGSDNPPSFHPKLRSAANCFKTAVRLETKRLQSAPASAGFECGNLLVALRSLAAVYASLGEYDQCLHCIDTVRYWKARKMPFPAEETTNATTNYEMAFEWVFPPTKDQGDSSMSHPRAVALKTVGEPLLDTATIRMFQEAAQSYRESAKESPEAPHSTRFTMQYPGNSDLHLVDLVAHQPTLSPVVENLLHHKVYPLVRRAFLTSSELSSLCVYDALLVRYDGDAAKREGREMGASLPLVGYS